MKIQLCDETPLGEVVGEVTLEVFTERMTVRELLRRRVYEEVRFYNLAAPGFLRGLAEPTAAEATLNGTKLRARRQVDPKQIYRQAIDAFERNGFFLLVDERQVEDLDEEITLRVDTRVSFIKLTPLVGG